MSFQKFFLLTLSRSHVWKWIMASWAEAPAVDPSLEDGRIMREKDRALISGMHKRNVWMHAHL
jgi:hypothetical protein